MEIQIEVGVWYDVTWTDNSVSTFMLMGGKSLSCVVCGINGKQDYKQFLSREHTSIVKSPSGCKK